MAQGGTSPRDSHPHILNKSMATTTATAQPSSAVGPAPAPILATGDWTKNLVHLAKTAELKCVSLFSLLSVRPYVWFALCPHSTPSAFLAALPRRSPRLATSLGPPRCRLTCPGGDHVAARRKHALTLQLHTAHILSAHAALEQKSKAIQDLKEQMNKYVLHLFALFPSPVPPSSANQS